jgi:hypothetical protein
MPSITEVSVGYAWIADDNCFLKRSAVTAFWKFEYVLLSTFQVLK